MRSGGIPQRARPAFSPRHYSSSNDPLSQRASPRANKRSAITATKPEACRLRSHVRDLHPIPLFSRTRSACPGLPGSRSCHKSGVLNFRMYQHRQNAGELPYRPALRRSLSCFACSRLAFFRSALVRLSSWRWASNSFWKRSVFVRAGWTRRTACSAGTPLAHRAFAHPRKRSSMRSPPITSVRPGICPSSARHWRR